MRLNNVALCHVHKAILDKLDVKTLMQEFVLSKDNCQSLFGKYFNLMLIIIGAFLQATSRVPRWWIGERPPDMAASCDIYK